LDGPERLWGSLIDYMNEYPGVKSIVDASHRHKDNISYNEVDPYFHPTSPYDFDINLFDTKQSQDNNGSIFRPWAYKSLKKDALEEEWTTIPNDILWNNRFWVDPLNGRLYEGEPGDESKSKLRLENLRIVTAPQAQGTGDKDATAPQETTRQDAPASARPNETAPASTGQASKSHSERDEQLYASKIIQQIAVCKEEILLIIKESNGVPIAKATSESNSENRNVKDMVKEKHPDNFKDEWFNKAWKQTAPERKEAWKNTNGGRPRNNPLASAPPGPT